MKTMWIIGILLVLALIYICVRFVLIAIIYYADTLKRKGLKK